MLNIFNLCLHVCTHQSCMIKMIPVVASQSLGIVILFSLCHFFEYLNLHFLISCGWSSMVLDHLYFLVYEIFTLPIFLFVSLSFPHWFVGIIILYTNTLSILPVQISSLGLWPIFFHLAYGIFDLLPSALIGLLERQESIRTYWCCQNCGVETGTEHDKK